nr:hypothetical protein L203_05716 [Cryptococcus depauperatus CBS 7841]
MCMASAGQQTPNIALRIIQNDLRMPGYNLHYVGGALGAVLGGIFTAHIKNIWRGALFCPADMAFAISTCALFIVPNDMSIG